MKDFILFTYGLVESVSILFLVIYILSILFYSGKLLISIPKKRVKSVFKELVYFIFLGFVGLSILDETSGKDFLYSAALNTIMYISIPIAILKLLSEMV